MQALFGQLLIGLINGAFYAMLSLGLAVIFGLLNIINFTHGAQYMMGAFCAWFLLNKAVIGDTGPKGIIGEASYATARDLGIDPDPATGGSDGPVTYICFKGSRVSPIESNARAAEVGAALATAFVESG